MTDQDLIEKCLSKMIRLTSANSLRAYRSDASHVISAMGTTYATATVDQFEDWRDASIKAGMPVTTLRRKMVVVSRIASMAAARGWIARDFTAGVEAPKHQKRTSLTYKAIPQADASRTAADAALSDRDRAIIHLGIQRMMRVSEIIGLRWCHITPTDDGGAYVFIKGKGGVERNGWANPETMAYVNKLWIDGTDPQSFVFHHHRKANGGQMSPYLVATMLKAAAKRSGITKSVTTHSLRHTGVTIAASQPGSNLVALADDCGHEDINVTRRYALSTPHGSAARHTVL